MDDARPELKCIRLPATTGPRPHRCEVCQRSFREVATLRKHEQLHRADRPYMCTTCGKSFLWSSNLKVHERVHTGERPYKCKICHRCFTQSNDLRRHERNVHMRGKFFGNKQQPGREQGNVSLAAYQAFAMQQRALLQQALAYESLMHNAAAVNQARIFQQQSGDTMTMPKPSDMIVSTSSSGTSVQRPLSSQSSIKLEQVTPPSTPGDLEQHGSERSTLHTPIGSEVGYMTSPARSYLQVSPPGSAPAVLQSSTSLASMLYQPPNSLELRDDSPGPPQLDLQMNISVGQHSYTSREKFNNLPQSSNQPTSSSFYDQKSSDSVIDLSINKSMSSFESEEEPDWKGHNSIVPKSPESEYEKRDVTTTSVTPTADAGIHHCQHCNIIFHDYTMFHLHQSLHSPVDENPFLCPSCKKHCQDRIEFMFHIVWHVKYPHTIPNYQPFKESYLA